MESQRVRQRKRTVKRRVVKKKFMAVELIEVVYLTAFSVAFITACICYFLFRTK